MVGVLRATRANLVCLKDAVVIELEWAKDEKQKCGCLWVGTSGWMDAIETRMRGSAEQSRGGGFNSGLADQGDSLRLQFVGSIEFVWLYAFKW